MSEDDAIAVIADGYVGLAATDDALGALVPPDLRLSRCPVCRLRFESEVSACPRCESDLRHVRAAHAGAWADVLLAFRAEATGDHATAVAASWRAASLVRCETTLSLYAELAGTTGVRPG